MCGNFALFTLLSLPTTTYSTANFRHRIFHPTHHSPTSSRTPGLIRQRILVEADQSPPFFTHILMGNYLIWVHLVRYVWSRAART